MTESRQIMLTVIIPAYNEAERIEHTIAALRTSLDGGIPGVDSSRILVVDDGSTDGTAELARSAGVDRVVRHRVNQGLGAAVRTGLDTAFKDGASIVVKFDADLQHDPADIPALVRPIVEDEADLVYGNRFERIDYRMPFVRRVGNFVFTRLMRWLTRWPLKDSQPGIFAVDRYYLERFHIPGNYNYTQQILLDAYHKGMRFDQVPVAFRRRETGKSFVSLKYPFKVLAQIFWLIVGLRPMKVFGTVGLLFVALAGGVLIWDLAQFWAGNSDKPAQHVNFILGAGLVGIQTLFFGVLAQLIVHQRR